jgi:hypothetical protein
MANRKFASSLMKMVGGALGTAGLIGVDCVKAAKIRNFGVSGQNMQ